MNFFIVCLFVSEMSMSPFHMYTLTYIDLDIDFFIEDNSVGFHSSFWDYTELRVLGNQLIFRLWKSSNNREVQPVEVQIQVVYCAAWERALLYLLFCLVSQEFRGTSHWINPLAFIVFLFYVWFWFHVKKHCPLLTLSARKHTLYSHGSISSSNMTHDATKLDQQTET